MALLLKSNLTPEEMKWIAKENGIKLSKDDLKLLSKMKKQENKIPKEKDAKKTKEQVENEVEKAKKEKGWNLTKAELMEILAKGNLSPDEILKIAKDNGIKLSKDDIAAIMKGKPQTKQMAKDKLDKLKKEKGKLSKDDFLAAVKDSDMTEAELKQLAK